MKIISLGGVGGCNLAQSLRDLNQLAYPYDWLITTQSFVIESFNNLDNFFVFNNNYVYDNSKLITTNKKAIMLHDFTNFILQEGEVIQKYKRRFERLNETLCSNDDILFVRIYDNLKEELIPNNYYNNILIREDEDILKWEDFINNNINKYNKNIKLLIIHNKEELINISYYTIILHYTKEHKNTKEIYNIIQKYI